ncbi:MAG: hypothetical protein JW708_11380 [Vallitaleaceae bacterium]|nr:hypothetical protein [Vallitaleaceae bacterium]
MIKLIVILLLIGFSIEAVSKKKFRLFSKSNFVMVSIGLCLLLFYYINDFLIRVFLLNFTIYSSYVMLIEKKSSEGLKAVFVSNMVLLPGSQLNKMIQVIYGPVHELILISIIAVLGFIFLKSPMLKRILNLDERNKQSWMISIEIQFLILFVILFLVEDFHFPKDVELMLYCLSLLIICFSMYYLYVFSKKDYYNDIKNKYTRALMGEYDSLNHPMFDLIQKKEEILFQEVEKMSESIRKGNFDVQEQIIRIKEKCFIQIRFTENQLLNTMLFSYYIDFESRGFLFEANFPTELKDEEKLEAYFDYLMMIFDFFDYIITCPQLYKKRDGKKEILSIHMIWNDTSYSIIGSLTGKISNFLLIEEAIKSRKERLKKQHFFVQTQINLQADQLEIEVFQTVFRKGRMN